MKVVLFCGGQGLRLREYSESIPKPMVPIGYRPILWHVMRYYAEFGHTEFILCLGYRADVIKDYFLRYRDAISSDFVLHGAGGSVEILGHLVASFGSQRSRTWFRGELFRGLMALRGMEGGATSGFAEAFTVRRSLVRRLG